MARTKVQAEKELADVLPRLGEVVRAALHGYADRYKDLRHEHSPRTRASLIADLMQGEALKRLDQFPGVRIVAKATTIYVGLYGKYVCKFKKLSAARHAASTGTFTAEGFANQLTLAPFPDAATNVFAGYILKELELKNSDVLLVCPRGPLGTEWHLDIPAPESVVQPMRPDAAPREQQRPRRAKKKVSNE